MEEEIHRYRDDPDWEDVRPIPLTDDEQAAVKIATNDEFNDAFMYLRAMVVNNELSERAFELTEKCIDLNPANYTLWQYRRVLLKALFKNISDEFELISVVIENNPKNYQVWHHRRILVEWTNDYKLELAFTAQMIESDAKNYHAWQHRHWIVEKYELFSEQELDYSSGLLLEDLRNNSAYNYRFFILQGLDALKDPNILNREIAMTEALIKRAPNNESAWNFLSGILIDQGISSRADVMQFCEELSNQKPSPHCLSFMVDVLVERIEKKMDVEENSKLAIDLLNDLINIDPIRRFYWQYNIKLVNNMITSMS